MSRPGRFLLRLCGILVLLAVLLFGSSWLVVWHNSSGRTHSATTTPAKTVTLVFGAAMWGKDPSPYLQGRLDVAANLYLTGKTEVIIVSGTEDGGYSEPQGMKDALVAAGVPAARIILDTGGDDTYSSCIRARDVYGATSLIVATQDYHMPRAIASCRMLGIDTAGVADTTQKHGFNWAMYTAREWIGDVKLIWDLLMARNPVAEGPSDAVAVALQSAR